MISVLGFLIICVTLVVAFGLCGLIVLGFYLSLCYLVSFFQYNYFDIDYCNTIIGSKDIYCGNNDLKYFIGSIFALHLFVFIICTIIMMIIIKIIIKTTFDYFNDYQNFLNFLKHLLQNGRKSLATVRDVQYRANSKKQYPEFVLRYAFNPPDDSEPDDLIHEIVVPYDPALKPGDVLPILYTVSEDSTEVMSMPFPFPVKALPELSSCYCKTIRGVILSTPNTARD